MVNETKLVNKVKRLIRRAGLPKRLHHFGPKKYEFWQHGIAYIVKQECKLGYRRVSKLLRGLGFSVPCPSAICTSFKKLPSSIWERLLQATTGCKVYIAAIDGSGMSRTLPSPYYVRRIDKPYPVEIPLKTSIIVDTRTKKILAVRLRAKPAHDVKDVKYLLKRLKKKPNKLVADKAYDAEWIHRHCHALSIQAMIPMRNYGTKKIYRGKSLRKRAQKHFNKITYHRREIVESVFSAIKRKFGASVSSLSAHTMRAEMYCRAITHNLFLKFTDFLNAAMPVGKILSEGETVYQRDSFEIAKNIRKYYEEWCPQYIEALHKISANK